MASIKLYVPGKMLMVSRWKLRSKSMSYRIVYDPMGEGKCVPRFSGRKAGRSLSPGSYEALSFSNWLLSSLTPFHTHGQSPLQVTKAKEQPMLWPSAPASRPINWDVVASANFEQPSRSHFWLNSHNQAILIKLITRPLQQCTVVLQIFGVVLFSVFSMVNRYTKIKMTP